MCVCVCVCVCVCACVYVCVCVVVTVAIEYTLGQPPIVQTLVSELEPEQGRPHYWGDGHLQ